MMEPSGLTWSDYSGDGHFSVGNPSGPPATFENPGYSKVPPSISRDGAGPWNDDYWICHAACVFETPKKPKKITEDQCRNESTFHVYNCQCGDLYNARQRLGV